MSNTDPKYEGHKPLQVVAADEMVVKKSFHRPHHKAKVVAMRQAEERESPIPLPSDILNREHVPYTPQARIYDLLFLLKASAARIRELRHHELDATNIRTTDDLLLAIGLELSK